MCSISDSIRSTCVFYMYVHVHVHMHIVYTHVYVQYAKVSLDKAHLGIPFSTRALQAEIASRRVGQHKAKVNVQPTKLIATYCSICTQEQPIIGQAGASPPSGTTGAQFIFV